MAFIGLDGFFCGQQRDIYWSDKNTVVENSTEHYAKIRQLLKYLLKVSV